MLKIDCLYKNTAIVEKIKQYIGSVAKGEALEGRNASFEAIYRKIRKDGIEVDMETAGHIYQNELPVDNDNRFSTRAEIEDVTRNWFKETARNLLVHKPKKGEKEISELSPGNFIAKKLAEAFSNNITEDHTTKTIFRQMQDIYAEASKRLLGDLPNKEAKAPERPFEETLAEAINRHNELGYTDKTTGKRIGLNKLHEKVQEVLGEYQKEINKSNDPVLKEQWNKYAKELQDATYSLALTHGEAKIAVEGALRASGYEKTTKDGRKVLDWEKLAGNINSERQLRDNSIDALKRKGFSEEDATRVADTLVKEHRELKAKILEIADAEQAKLKKSWEPSVRKEPVKIDDVIANQVRRWETYVGHEGREGAPLILSKKSAGEALKHAIIESGLSRATKNGVTLDIDKLSNAIYKPEHIKEIATKYFEGQKNGDGTTKYDTDKVNRLSNAIGSMYEEMFNKVKEHVIGKREAIESAWEPKEKKDQPTTDDIISKRLKEHGQYQKITGEFEKIVKFTPNEAQKIVGEVLKNTDQYGKGADDKKQIDWQKLAQDRPTQQKLTDAIFDAEKAKGASNYDANVVAHSLARDYHPMLEQAITDHANAILEGRQKAIDRDTPERKTAIHRLAELHSLGIFDEAHQKLLYHTLGVDQANIEDLNALKQIAGAVSDLRQETGGKDYLNNFAYQSADRIVSRIIERNKDSHSRLLRITQAINHTFGLMNMSLIGNPYNLVENNFSGKSAVLGSKGELAKQMGGKNAAMFTDSKLWRAVWKDVAVGGVEYGGAGDKWSHIGGYTDQLNSLNFKENPVKAIKTAVLLPFKGLLNGSDAANKAVLHQKGMLLMLHKALTSQGMSSDEAANHLHEALYGQSYEQAKDRAGQLIAKYGERLGIGKSEYAIERAKTRWANELVRANLNMSADAALHNSGEPPVGNDDIIEAALESSFHAAAVSLGHEANNPESKGIHAGKIAAMHEEKELIEQEKYGAAARARFFNNLYWNGIKRMQSGGMNWAVLRAEGTGMGLYAAFGGDIKKELDFTSKDALQQAMSDRILASRKVARAFTGMTLAALTISALGIYGETRNKEDDDNADEGAVESGIQGVSKSYAMNKLMGKAGPDLAFMYYLGKTNAGEGEGAAVFAGIKYVENLINSNPSWTIGGHLMNAGDAIRRGKFSDKSIGLAEGQVGSIVGDMFSLPLYRPFKQIYQIGTGNPRPPQYTKPQSIAQGMVGGGAIQDFVNELPQEYIDKWNLEDWQYPDNQK